MKTIAITSKTSMIVPARFTMKELKAANDTDTVKVGYPTLNARVDKLVKSGEIIEVATVKTSSGRGRAEIVYALKDASLNPKDKTDPLYLAKKQGRLIPVASVTVSDGVAPAVPAETVTVPVEVVQTAAETVVDEVVPSAEAAPVEVTA
jgi:hypothetical protein